MKLGMVFQAAATSWKQGGDENSSPIEMSGPGDAGLNGAPVPPTPLLQSSEDLRDLLNRLSLCIDRTPPPSTHHAQIEDFPSPEMRLYLLREALRRLDAPISIHLQWRHLFYLREDEMMISGAQTLYYVTVDGQCARSSCTKAGGDWPTGWSIEMTPSVSVSAEWREVEASEWNYVSANRAGLFGTHFLEIMSLRAAYWNALLDRLHVEIDQWQLEKQTAGTSRSSLSPVTRL